MYFLSIYILFSLFIDLEENRCCNCMKSAHRSGCWRIWKTDLPYFHICFFFFSRLSNWSFFWYICCRFTRSLKKYLDKFHYWGEDLFFYFWHDQIFLSFVFSIFCVSVYFVFLVSSFSLFGYFKKIIKLLLIYLLVFFCICLYILCCFCIKSHSNFRIRFFIKSNFIFLLFSFFWG